MDRPPNSPERPDPFLEGIYHSLAARLITHGEIDTQLALRNENIRHDRSGAEVHTYLLTIPQSNLSHSDRPDLVGVSVFYEQAYMLANRLTPDSINVIAQDAGGVQKDITLNEVSPGIIEGYVVIEPVEELPRSSQEPPFQDIHEALEEWRLERHALDMGDLDLLRDILQLMNDD